MSSVLTWDLDIMVKHTHVAPLAVEFEIVEPTILVASGHAVIRHRKNYPCGIGWGLYQGVRGPFASIALLRASVNEAVTSQPATLPTWIGIVSGNLEREEHYKAIPITGARQLTESGFYRVETWASLHGSTACSSTPTAPEHSYASFLIESSGPQNQITYRLIPGTLSPRRIP
jgi:hypothetical protein